MARLSDEELQKLVQKQDAEVYGEETFEPEDLDAIASETYGNVVEDDQEIDTLNEIEGDDEAEAEIIEDDPQTLEDFENLDDE